LKSFRGIQGIQVIQVIVAFVVFSTVLGRADAGPEQKVIAVVNRADWCSVCQANHARAGQALGEAAADGSVKILVNDLTNEETTKKSAERLKAAGLDKSMAPYLASGVITFFDAKTKKVLSQITVANADPEIKMASDLAKKHASK